MAERDGEQYEQYSHKKAIENQIRYLNNKIGEADLENSQSFNNYFNKVFMALSSLDAIATPFKDEKYEGKLKDAEPRQMSVADKLNFIHEAQVELMELFDRQNIFYETKRGRTEV